MENSITVSSGANAWRKLSDPDFLNSWAQLYAGCPWATPFQSPAFVCTWYEHYQNQYQPVVFHLAEDQHLGGLLTLALSADKRRLRVAGAPQSEYQVWLARPERQANFVRQIPNALEQAFRGYDLIFKHLPSELPVQPLRQAGVFSRRAEVRVFQSPLMMIEKEDLEASFGKKSNKSRFNRLRRLGKLEFKRLTDRKAFAGLLDEIIPYYDLRQGAVNDRYPFMHDPAKVDFHLDLLEKHPELMHITVTTLDEKVLAAHIGIVGKEQVYLGILAYSPFYGGYSLGKIHLMLLGRQLMEEGINCLDLTPGEDAWKERFANAHNETAVLTFYGSTKAQTINLVKTQGKIWIRKGGEVFHLPPERIQQISKNLKRLRLRNALSNLSPWAWKMGEIRVYRLSLEPAQDPPRQTTFKRDHLEDLLLYDEAGRSGPSKQAFLADALERLERNEHVYSLASGGRLNYCSWLAEQASEIALSKAGLRYQIPEKSAALYHFSASPVAGGDDLFEQALRQMLADLRQSEAIQQAYVFILADNAPARQAVEQLGFEYQRSVFYTRILGASR